MLKKGTVTIYQDHAGDPRIADIAGCTGLHINSQEELDTAPSPRRGGQADPTEASARPEAAAQMSWSAAFQIGKKPTSRGISWAATDPPSAGISPIACA